MYPSTLHLGHQPFNLLESTACPGLKEAMGTSNSLVDSSVLVIQSGQVDIDEGQASAKFIQDHGVRVPQGLLEFLHHLSEALATAFLEREAMRDQ